MERNLHETTSWWKTYGKQLLSEDLEIQDVSFLVQSQFGIGHASLVPGP